MSEINILKLIACFALSFLFSSFCEYWVHRVFHISPQNPIKYLFPQIGRIHAEHHIDNSGQGVLWEFRDYAQIVALYLIMFLYSWEAGIGFFLGGMIYCVFAAYAHQLQHDNPTKCFWMEMPVHYVHHKNKQWDHNFGIGVDWWDRIFNTYKQSEWLTQKELSESDRGYLELKWW